MCEKCTIYPFLGFPAIGVAARRDFLRRAVVDSSGRPAQQWSLTGRNGNKFAFSGAVDGVDAAVAPLLFSAQQQGLPTDSKLQQPRSLHHLPQHLH